MSGAFPQIQIGASGRGGGFARLGAGCADTRDRSRIAPFSRRPASPSLRPSIIPPLTDRRGGGWVLVSKAQPLQSRIQRPLGEAAVSVSNPIQPLQTAVFAGNRSILACSNPGRDGNRERVVHVHSFDNSSRTIALHAHTGDGLSVPGAETLKPNPGGAEAIPEPTRTFA